MKKAVLLLTATLIYGFSFTQARLATADYQKTMRPAVETDIPFPEKTVMKAIDDKMQQLGYKGKDNNGYKIYKGVHIAAIGQDSYDFYFKADRKSKKEKDASILTLMLSTGFEKFIADTTNAPVISNAKTYLDGLTAMVTAYDLEQQIAEQEDVVKKLDKKLNNLTDDGQDLQKKKSKLEKEIQENLKDQADQKAEADKQQQILENLKGKRKQ